MLIEATCDKLEFLTNLENYPLFEAKFDVLLNTLVTVYDCVDNSLANCMALILLNNDPKLETLNEEQKNILVSATIRKLNYILDYLKGEDVSDIAYSDLEIIIDLACYMNNQTINELVSKFDEFNDKINQVVYVSATPGDYELDLVDNKSPYIYFINSFASLIEYKHIGLYIIEALFLFVTLSQQVHTLVNLFPTSRKRGQLQGLLHKASSKNLSVQKEHLQFYFHYYVQQD